jgi:predicted ATPase
MLCSVSLDSVVASAADTRRSAVPRTITVRRLRPTVSSGLVVLEGSAGTGKTALLGAVTRLARDADMRVISARGGELEQEQPFGVIRQLYEPVLAAASPGERDRLLAGAAAPAVRVLGVGTSGEGSHAAGFAAMHAIYWLTVELALDPPLVAIVDDAHWADASSLGALDYLARRLADPSANPGHCISPGEPGAPQICSTDCAAPPMPA